MKKILAALAATALVFTLGACSDNTDESANPTVTVTEQAPEPEAPEVEPGGPVAEAAFVSVMREQFPYETAGVSDSEIIRLGETTCEFISSYNGDIEGALTFLITPPDAVDPLFASFTIGASVPAFCPEWQSAVDDFVNSDSGFGSDA
jgi:hypothetical protein